ncbi:MAG: hypothetical protein C0609_12445 [Deltaproteobacteria bacterium]|nr:MAG: hypothetical protein C0609_12445 [Deltaproteobacteria bacterium]
MDNLNVLVVDDEKLSREMLSELLGKSGHTVITAADGLEGLELFKKHHTEISLVILDLTMPRMNGDEALPLMRDFNDAVPVLVASGYSEDEVMRRFVDSGATPSGIIMKPFSMVHLNDLMSKLQS